MDKNLLFVINPHSGRAEIKSRALMIIDSFVKHGYSVTVYTTQNQGSTDRAVGEIGDKFDRIVCCGGDGTVNETLNGIMRLDKRPPLALIPSGTTNDYAYSLSIPFNMNKAAEIAMTDKLFNVDVGSFNGRYFAYVAAFGLFTDVTYETPQDAKNMLGSVAYVLEGAKRINTLRRYHVKVEYDGGLLEDDVILGFFSNTVSVAGIRNAFSDAKLNDGLLEITLIKVPKTLRDAQTIINILLNFEKASESQSDFLRVITAKKARITCDTPIAWTIDGESGGSFTDVIIENCPKAIDVVVG
ncbi:MAG: diacylglycerol kinase family lipid kinase [Oscillospiraceae bacterium]